MVNDVRARNASQVPAYDPGKIRVPTMVVVGEWDRETTPEQGRTVFELLPNDVQRRYVVIGGATHSMLLENQRGALHRVVDGFLKEGWQQ